MLGLCYCIGNNLCPFSSELIFLFLHLVITNVDTEVSYLVVCNIPCMSLQFLCLEHSPCLVIILVFSQTLIHTESDLPNWEN